MCHVIYTSESGASCDTREDGRTGGREDGRCPARRFRAQWFREEAELLTRHVVTRSHLRGEVLLIPASEPPRERCEERERAVERAMEGARGWGVRAPRITPRRGGVRCRRGGGDRARGAHHPNETPCNRPPHAARAPRGAARRWGWVRFVPSFFSLSCVAHVARKMPSTRHHGGKHGATSDLAVVARQSLLSGGRGSLTGGGKEARDPDVPHTSHATSCNDSPWRSRGR